jgi:G protein-coupled receptor kinase interactor 2
MLQSGQHLIIPEQSRVEINEHLKIARGKLQLIPNKMFEELVMDLYEEVDRREMETSKLIQFRQKIK